MSMERLSTSDGRKTSLSSHLPLSALSKLNSVSLLIQVYFLRYRRLILSTLLWLSFGLTVSIVVISCSLVGKCFLLPCDKTDVFVLLNSVTSGQSFAFVCTSLLLLCNALWGLYIQLQLPQYSNEEIFLNLGSTSSSTTLKESDDMMNDDFSHSYNASEKSKTETFYKKPITSLPSSLNQTILSTSNTAYFTMTAFCLLSSIFLSAYWNSLATNLVDAEFAFFEADIGYLICPDSLQRAQTMATLLPILATFLSISLLILFFSRKDLKERNIGNLTISSKSRIGNAYSMPPSYGEEEDEELKEENKTKLQSASSTIPESRCKKHFSQKVGSKGSKLSIDEALGGSEIDVAFMPSTTSIPGSVVESGDLEFDL